MDLNQQGDDVELAAEVQKDKGHKQEAKKLQWECQRRRCLSPRSGPEHTRGPLTQRDTLKEYNLSTQSKVST